MSANKTKKKKHGLRKKLRNKKLKQYYRTKKQLDERLNYLIEKAEKS